jgi:polysaccharide biosynthesis protein PslE
MIEIRSLRDLARVLYIFGREFRVALWLTAALMVLGAFLLPHQYTSEARLLVKSGRENTALPVDLGDRQAAITPSATRDPIIDEEKMLTGRPVVREVARLYLNEMQAREQQGSGLKQALRAVKRSVSGAIGGGLQALGLSEPQSDEDALAERLAARFSVSHGPGSNVMDLSLKWNDAQQAQRILSTWVRIYIDQRTTVLGRKGLVAFYEGKVRDSDLQIDAAKSQLRTGLEAINGASAQERLDALTQRLNDLRTRLAEIGAERSALEAGISYAAGRVKALPGESVAERDLSQSAGWQAMSTQLADLKRQRTDALRVYKDSAPAVRNLNESIAQLEAQLKAEDRVVQRAEKRMPNELSVTMARTQLEKSVRLRELDTLNAAFDKEVTKLEAQRRKVLQSEPELGKLEQQLAVAEKSRAFYLDTLEKARVDQALDDRRLNNIAQIQEASFNPARSGPKSLLMLFMALPAGAVVGLVVVYLCTLMDQRIHDGGRLAERFGVPVWSTVKDVSNGVQDNEFHASLHRIYGTLPLPRIASEGLVLGLTAGRHGEGVSFIAQHLQTLCEAQGLSVSRNPDTVQRSPGVLTLLEASGLQDNQQAFVRLSQADLIVLVVEARATTIPVLDNALGVLRTAFHRVDGVILNRRRFEVPQAVLRWLQP